ncbi:uncharacterized protein N7443_002665 [Penicillium atrosanguineum]|uniref:uncharacterized protein n=1 Tax=Penicillium atrosanguineum TaxID=1132637 RepID=UPI00238614DC|nr:uncharacterized protein N7443_002665 [Penicillium atrosanguineum]KAJ5310204.1 hypothetical protein N7443_002665 [Penicillium atrosanguineum]
MSTSFLKSLMEKASSYYNFSLYLNQFPTTSIAYYEGNNKAAGLVNIVSPFTIFKVLADLLQAK